MGARPSLEDRLPRQMSVSPNSASTYEYDIVDLTRMSLAKNYRRWLYESLEPYLGKSILEIGAGIGDLTELIARRRRVCATDISDGCLRRLAERFSGRPDVEVSRLDILDMDVEVWRRKNIDTAISMQLLEHMRDDRKAIANIFGILPDGGNIVAMVPALKPLYGTIDRALGHHRRYSREEISEKVAGAGFSVTDCFYLNMAGAIGWFINARIFHRTVQSSLQIGIFDKIVVPIMSRIEKRFKSVPFGQTLFCIGRKPPAGRSGAH